MPSFSKALSFLLMSSTTWPITTATATNSHPVFLSDDGRSSNRRHVQKYGKKQNIQRCTLDHFAGEFKYMDCEDHLTKVEIACGTNQCEYEEYRIIDDDSDEHHTKNTDDGCVVHGSFDITDITMDPASSVCQLDFVALKDSCDVDALPVNFGMKAEVNVTTRHDDTSSMLLWFSIDGGSVYYNEGEPRVTAFLNHDLQTTRKLRHVTYDSCLCFC